VQRPPTGIFQPEFWPVVRGVDLARTDGSGLALLPRTSTGLRYGSDGSVDVMVSRNAAVEHCDVLGAMGHEQGPPTVSFALLPHASGIDLRAAALALADAPAVQLTGTAMSGHDSGQLLALGGSGYVLSAAKQAERGAGVILRFERTASGAMVQMTPGVLAPATVTRTDLLERDSGAGSMSFALDAPLVTVRLGM
jgi:hypothetical protein